MTQAHYLVLVGDAESDDPKIREMGRVGKGCQCDRGTDGHQFLVDVTVLRQEHDSGQS